MNSKKWGILRFLAVIAFIFSFSFTYAEDWSLAAQRFEFSQQDSFSSATIKSAELIPQLILDQIASGYSRFIDPEELLERKIVALRTERQSLSLQLAKELKTRDSYVLSEKTQRVLTKKIKSSQKKISEIQVKIDENLKIQSELKSQFFRDKDFKGNYEKVLLYKNSGNDLFVRDESRDLQDDLMAKKINALITGSIIVYGDYLCVTVTLTRFPGYKELACITEIGSDFQTIAENLALALIPFVTNSNGLNVRITVDPPELASQTKMFLDGTFYNSIPENLVIQTGIHTLEFFCSGYRLQSAVYNFENALDFDVYVPLIPETIDTMFLDLNANDDALVYFNGQLAQKNNRLHLIKINGNNVLGQVVSPAADPKKNSQLSRFFYVPKDIQSKDALVMSNVKLMNSDEYINNRRKWMYRGYSSVVISLPVLFYTMGKSQLGENGAWNTAYNVSIGITAACTGFFVYELVRYLISANSVLPVEAKVVPKNKQNVHFTDMNKDVDSATDADKNIKNNGSEESVE